MRFPVGQRPAYFLDEHGTFLLGDKVLTFFACFVRPSLFQLLCGHKGNFIRKVINGIRPFVPDFMLHMLDDLKDVSDDRVQYLRCSVCLADDHFPIPLVNVAGMKVIEVLVSSNRVHVSVKTFARLEPVFLERKSLPFCKRLDDFIGLSRDGLDIELNRTFHAV